MSRAGLMVLPPDPGRKSAHLVLLEHYGGGWYQAVCFGGAKKCKAGECRHVTGLGLKNEDTGKVRRVKAVARSASGEER